MNLVQRVQDILLKPKETWPVIAAEPGDAKSLFMGYVAVLASIPPLASFVSMALGELGMYTRVPLLSSLVASVVAYAVSLGMVLLLGFWVDKLAPSFGGTRNPVNALKVVAYAMTPGFVAGVLNLVPSLSVLGTLAGLYGIYLLYLGLPVLMRCPPGKAAGYTTVVTIGGIAAGMVVGTVMAMLTPTMGW